jgi:FSR family fosmidomycin resistance protein-like MFS transporter
MAVLSAGHLFTDVAQGSVPALLLFLKSREHLSYGAAAALVLAATISSSVIQPVFGSLSDRLSLPWLMPLGPALGGLGIALAGVAPSYGLILAAVTLSGVGVAAFHPEGSRFANYVSGERRASGMSLFSVGGNIGFALGPLLVTPLVLAFGLAGTLFLLIPTWLMAAVLVHELPRLRGFRRDVVGGRVERTEQSEAWGPFTVLAGVIVVRSFIYFGLVTFIPLYFVHVLHTGKALGATALTAMLLGGAVGTLIGGPLADRFGRRTVLTCSMTALPPLVVLFLISGSTIAVGVAAVTGAVTIATFAVTIVMGQEYLPGRIGASAGVTIGLSIGLGGAGAPLLGLLADAHGLRAVFEAIAALPVLALLLTLALPVSAPGIAVVGAEPAEAAAVPAEAAAVPAEAAAVPAEAAAVPAQTG